MLSKIAEAAREAAAKTIEVTIQQINFVLQNAGGITDIDEKSIAQAAGEQIAYALHQARLLAERGASPQLAGAR
jgi:hypothetical protein